MNPLDSNEFRFEHNGVNYTVRLMDLDHVPEWINRDPIEHALETSDFAETKALIARVKNSQ